MFHYGNIQLKLTKAVVLPSHGIKYQSRSSKRPGFFTSFKNSLSDGWTQHNSGGATEITTRDGKVVVKQD